MKPFDLTCVWMCASAGVAGDQCVPVCPFLHGLPGGEMVLHQGPAWGESHLHRFSHNMPIFGFFTYLF